MIEITGAIFMPIFPAKCLKLLTLTQLRYLIQSNEIWRIALYDTFVH